jgi:hypothetical protein
MGCGIEPRKEEFCGGRDARNRRRQHVRHRYARCRRSAGVEGHITSERSASEPERSHVRPQAAEPTGPHREGEEPKPMMHGHEKSDSAIVATKPPNKAGRPAAEAVERRAEAKENANRCRTCRTQCRESVSPTPERVRKAEASRQTSEVGAVCRKAARTVLCGGRPVMGVPTAIARRNREILLSRRSSTDLVWLRPPDGLGALAPRVEEFGDAGSCYLPAHRSGHWPWRDAIGQEPRNGKMKNQHRRIQQSTRVTVRLGILGACQGVRHLLEY